MTNHGTPTPTRGVPKISHHALTRLFRTRRGEIDHGEAENGLKTPYYENKQKSIILAKLVYFGPVGGKSTLEKQNQASKWTVMKVTKIQ